MEVSDIQNELSEDCYKQMKVFDEVLKDSYKQYGEVKTREWKLKKHMLEYCNGIIKEFDKFVKLPFDSDTYTNSKILEYYCFAVRVKQQLEQLTSN